MSFVKTLATLAVGFAAARGVQKVREMGGMDAVKDKLRKAGEPGGMADDIGAMAQKMGIPVQQEQLRGMFDSFGKTAAQATEATETGLGSLMGTMGAGAKTLSGMMAGMVEGTPMEAVSEDAARLMIRAMIQAAKSDGEIDEAERKAILDQLSDASDEEVAFVQEALDAPVDVQALAADTAEASRAQVYSAALMAITVDTDAERAYLASLAQALQLDAAKVASLHAAMGRTAP